MSHSGLCCRHTSLFFAFCCTACIPPCHFIFLFVFPAGQNFDMQTGEKFPLPARKYGDSYNNTDGGSYGGRSDSRSYGDRGSSRHYDDRGGRDARYDSRGADNYRDGVYDSRGSRDAGNDCLV